MLCSASDNHEEIGAARFLTQSRRTADQIVEQADPRGPTHNLECAARSLERTLVQGVDGDGAPSQAIPLARGPSSLDALLDRRLAARRLDSPLIFHNGEGRHVGNFSTTWRRALRNAKVAFVFHDLRRTAIRNMIRAGVPERVAMEISGHRTRAIFARYNIVSGHDLDDAMTKRAAYEAEMATAKTRTNASKEPVAFPAP